MAVRKKNIALRIIFIVLSVVIICIAGFVMWLSHHYKQLITERLPGIIENSTDSVYHISFTDISISVFRHRVTITGLRLWPDNKQVAALRTQHRRTPKTLSTVSIASLDAYQVNWGDIAEKGSVDCGHVDVKNLKWLMECTPHPEDSLYERDKKKTPFIKRITAKSVDFAQPDITYKYKGPVERFTYLMKGGTATLNHWAYNDDDKTDTSVFLYAHDGVVRFNSFELLKSNGHYTIKKPILDFASTPNSVTLKNVHIKDMTDADPKTGNVKEIYNTRFPEIEMKGFNWNKLINDNKLLVTALYARDALIEIRYFDEFSDNNLNKLGDYPHQLLLQVGVNTRIKEANIQNANFKYTEVTTKQKEAVISFTHIHGQLRNVTNMKKPIAKDKDCVIELHGKFMDKSDMSATFNLDLSDTTGRFTLDGYLDNLSGDEVTPQAQVFTIVKVTSFHLNRMDMHIEGDETYAKGAFTVLYQDLKISLLKFDTKEREGKKGLFAFVGSAVVLYPDNPMPGKDARKVTTTFARDTTKGFIALLWQNMYRAAKKTAVRDQGLIVLTDGRETGKGEVPKKGFFKRLFHKKK